MAYEFGVYRRETKMIKAKVYKAGDMWYGQVYPYQTHYGWWGLASKCWQIVTEPCYTEFGAKRALKRWMKGLPQLKGRHTEWTIELESRT